MMCLKAFISSSLELSSIKAKISSCADQFPSAIKVVGVW